MAKTLKDFQRLHHPLAEASKVWKVNANPAPKGTIRFLFTAAQNGTPVNPKVWAAILHMRTHLDAHLSVIELRYKNPTSKWSRSQEDREVWAPEVRPYALNQSMRVNKNLVCVGSIKVVPTASNPLGEFEGFTGAESTIVGHTKYQFKTVPVPGNQMAKLMTTTGACTEPNYTNSRAGAKGEFHHTFGVVLVELDKGGLFYLRHINFTDLGVGIDLDTMYTPVGIFPAPPPEAITLGDTHVRFTDKQVDAANFGPRGMVTRYKPKRIYWEDVCDGHSVNHHEWDDPFIEQANAESGFDDVQAEVFEAIDFVVHRTPLGSTSYLVPDNHGDFLHTWIKKRDWKKLPTIQRAFYLETAARMHENSHMGPDGAEIPHPWPYWVKRRIAEVWDESFAQRVVVLTGKPGEEGSRVMGVQMDMHGHKGPNGARGSVKNLARIGTKATTAHGHSPAVEEGHHRVGTNSRLRLKYIQGSPSGWLHANDFLHANGKRQLILIINGKYRLESK